MSIIDYIMEFLKDIFEGIKEKIFGSASGLDAISNLISYLEKGISNILASPTKLIAITIFVGILLMIGKTLEKILEISFVIFLFLSIISILMMVF